MKTDRFEKTFTTVPGAQRTTRRWRRGLVSIVIVLAVAAGYLWFYAPQYLPAYLAQYRQTQIQEAGGRGSRALRGDGPVPVLAAVASKADVPVYFDGVGTSRALNTVTVKAQVDGKLMSVNFKEGQDVDQDFVLAEIDSTIYQAQYDQAVAKKAMDEAQLANARLDLERYARLMQTNSATRQQHDTQRALVAQLEAQVQARTGELQALSMRLLRVQEEERRAIARELHDHLGQLLTGLKFQLEAAHRGAPPAVQGACHPQAVRRGGMMRPFSSTP